MITFLPFANFKESAIVLDNRRLIKQLVENEQILNVLDNPSAPWGRHPSVISWRGYRGGLVDYSLAIGAEIKRRGYKCDIVLPRIIKNHNDHNDHCEGSAVKLPNWIGVEINHSSFRGRLKCKGRADAVCERIRSRFHFHGINKWLLANNFPIKPELKMAHILALEQFANKLGCDLIKNWYDQYGWSEDYLDNYYQLVAK